MKWLRAAIAALTFSISVSALSLVLPLIYIVMTGGWNLVVAVLPMATNAFLISFPAGLMVACLRILRKRVRYVWVPLTISVMQVLILMLLEMLWMRPVTSASSVPDAEFLGEAILFTVLSISFALSLPSAAVVCGLMRYAWLWVARPMNGQFLAGR